MDNSKTIYKDKIKELYNKTIESDLRFEGKLNNIDYFSILCKATSCDNMIKFQNSNLCMFNYRYNNRDSILIIFAIPISEDSDDKQTKGKHISERIMNIIKLIEDFFVTTDYMECKQVKEDKFAYLTIVKYITTSIENEQGE